MLEVNKKNLKFMTNLVFFFIFIGLVIYGQRTVGYSYLFIQLIGLSGLLAQLWKYNKKFK